MAERAGIDGRRRLYAVPDWLDTWMQGLIRQPCHAKMSQLVARALFPNEVVVGDGESNCVVTHIQV